MTVFWLCVESYYGPFQSGGDLFSHKFHKAHLSAAPEVLKDTTIRLETAWRPVEYIYMRVVFAEKIHTLF